MQCSMCAGDLFPHMVKMAPEVEHCCRACEQGQILIFFFTSIKTCQDMARGAAAAAARCFFRLSLAPITC